MRERLFMFYMKSLSYKYKEHGKEKNEKNQ